MVHGVKGFSFIKTYVHSGNEGTHVSLWYYVLCSWIFLVSFV